MKKLKLENFRIAALSSPQTIKGGFNIGDDDDVTDKLVCVNLSQDWVKSGSDTIDEA